VTLAEPHPPAHPRGYLIKTSPGTRVRLTESAWPLLRGEQTLTLAKPRTRVPTKAAQSGGARRPRRHLAGMEWTRRFERSNAAQALATDQACAYVVFSDATLAEMAARKPCTPPSCSMWRRGPDKAATLRDAFIDVIAGRRDEGHRKVRSCEPLGSGAQR